MTSKVRGNFPDDRAAPRTLALRDGTPTALPWAFFVAAGSCIEWSSVGRFRPTEMLAAAAWQPVSIAGDWGRADYWCWSPAAAWRWRSGANHHDRVSELTA